MDSFSRVAMLAQTAVQKLQVRSALNPVLWLCAITTPSFLVAAYVFGEPLRTVFAIGALVPPAIACFSFIGFALFKPDKLQSEDYQIRHESLQIIQQKVGRLTVNPASLDAIANPVTALLKPGEEVDS